MCYQKKAYSCLITLACLLWMASSFAARAATTDWSGGGADNVWSNAANWGGTTPTTGDTNRFNTSANPANSLINLNADYSSGGLIVGPTQNYALTLTNAASTLTIGAYGINMTNAGADLAVNVGGVTLGTNQAWNVGSSRTLSVSNAIAGSATLTKTGAGTLTLTGTNTYSGATTVSAGTLTVNGGMITNSGILVGNTAGTTAFLVVTNGGKVYCSGGIDIGQTSVSATGIVIITGNNSLLDNGGGVGGTAIQVGIASSGNQILVSDGGVLTNGPLWLCYSAGVHNNSVIITNGGRVYTTSSGLNIGGTTLQAGGNYSNWIYVGSATAAPSLLNGVAGNINIGSWYNCSNNWMTVDRGGIVTNVAAINVGSSSNCFNNFVAINGGQVFGAGTLSIGTGQIASNNTVTVTNGGLLQCLAISLGAVSMPGSGNRVTIGGGILQFTTGNPVITNNNADAASSRVAINNGTVSYRLSSGVMDLTNNWSGTGNGIGGTNVAWSGSNALRLNNSTATNTLAGGYTFANNLGSTNYTRLELVNGTNMVKGTGITFDGAHGGTLMLSNTVASFPCGVAMTGGATNILAGPVTVLSNFTIGADAVINWNYSGSGSDAVQVKNGTLTLPSSAILNVVGMPGSLWTTNTPPVLFSADAPISGSVGNWVVQGDCPKNTAAVIQGNQVILKQVIKGTLLSVY